MYKNAGHVEDRAKERTDITNKEIAAARSYVKSNRKKFKKGQTYSIAATGRKGYYVVGDIGKKRKKHVIKTVYGANMTPPGNIIQNAMLERELVKAAEALFALEKTASAVAISVAELNFEKAAAAYSGYTWEEWLLEDEHVKEAFLTKAKGIASGIRGFVNRKGADALSRIGVSNKALAGSRQQAAKSYSNRAKALEAQAGAQAANRVGGTGKTLEFAKSTPKDIAATQTAAAKASARAAEQGRLGAQGMTGSAAQSEMAIAKAQQGHASRQLRAANKETGLINQAKANRSALTAQQKAVTQAEAQLAGASTRPAQEAARANLATQQKNLAQAQKTNAQTRATIQSQKQIKQMAGGGGPKPTPAATPAKAPSVPQNAAQNAAPQTNPSFFSRAANTLTSPSAKFVGAAGLGAGGFLGAEHMMKKQQQKVANWFDIKNRTNSMVEALSMYKEASLVKTALSSADKKLMKEFEARKRDLRKQEIQLEKQHKAYKSMPKGPEKTKARQALNAAANKVDAFRNSSGSYRDFLQSKGYKGEALEQTSAALEAKDFGKKDKIRAAQRTLQAGKRPEVDRSDLEGSKDAIRKSKAGVERAIMVARKGEELGARKGGKGKFRRGAREASIAQGYAAQDRATKYLLRKGVDLRSPEGKERLENLTERLKDHRTLRKKKSGEGRTVARASYGIDADQHFSPEGKVRSRAARRAVNKLSPRQQKRLQENSSLILSPRANIIGELDSRARNTGSIFDNRARNIKRNLKDIDSSMANQLDFIDKEEARRAIIQRQRAEDAARAAKLKEQKALLKQKEQEAAAAKAVTPPPVEAPAPPPPPPSAAPQPEVAPQVQAQAQPQPDAPKAAPDAPSGPGPSGSGPKPPSGGGGGGARPKRAPDAPSGMGRKALLGGALLGGGYLLNRMRNRGQQEEQ